MLFHSKYVATCWQTLFAITVLDGREEKKFLEKVVFFCFFFLQVPHADSVEVTGLKKVSPKSAAKRLSNVNPACESIGKALDSKNMLSLFGNKKQAKK